MSTAEATRPQARYNLTVPAAARLSGLSIPHLRRLMSEGFLSYQQIPGGWTKLDREELERFVAKHVRPATRGMDDDHPDDDDDEAQR
jgi:hypothetical protein